jgi:hypothetical protein
MSVATNMFDFDVEANTGLPATSAGDATLAAQWGWDDGCFNSGILGLERFVPTNVKPDNV